ncbi:EM14S01-3B_G0007910.mRNA.1.CDS.1 [Saccharomyces cerevisiae]|nr:EM14S01-3B_G0007910.mRNA.1.CDS.1 [Saccharomyces cerevisiae]
MIIIFIELCRIADSLLWIPKSLRRTRRTSSIFCIPNIIAFINNGIPTIISNDIKFIVGEKEVIREEQVSKHTKKLLPVRRAWRSHLTKKMFRDYPNSFTLL